VLTHWFLIGYQGSFRVHPIRNVLFIALSRWRNLHSTVWSIISMHMCRQLHWKHLRSVSAMRSCGLHCWRQMNFSNLFSILVTKYDIEPEPSPESL